MALPEIAADAASVVVRGQFDPSKISPQWMLSHGLIGAVDFEALKYEIFLPVEVSVFDIGWMLVTVKSDLLQLQAHDAADFERLRDLTLGVLRHESVSPVSVLGINRHVHLSVASLSAWHAVGDAVANNSFWGDCLVLSGMRSATFTGVRPDLYAGQIDVRVEPSNKVHPGIFVSCNDHFSLETVSKQPATREEFPSFAPRELPEASTDKVQTAIQILTEEWASSLRRSDSIVERLARQAKT